MRGLLAELGGANRLIFTDQDHKKLLVPVVMALMVCEQHHGQHHFAVIREGAGLVLSETGVQCLLAQGVDLTFGAKP